MNDPKYDALKEKAEQLRRRLDYSPHVPEHDNDLRDGPPTPPPPAEKKAFARFCATVTGVLAESINKTAAELVSDTRGEAKDDAAVRAAVRAKVEQKYPNLLKKQAMLTVAERVFMSKDAAGLLQRVAKGIASEAGTHKAELAGLGILGVGSADQLQAHARAGLAGDYNKAGVKKREVLPHVAHPLLEAGGLGVLAAPSALHLLGKH